MREHRCSALAHEGRPRTNVVEVLVGEDYAPQVPHPYAGLGQGGADYLGLTRQACVDQRVTVLLIHDQGQVEEALRFLWTSWYRQDVHTVSNPHSSPLRLYFSYSSTYYPALVMLTYLDGSA